MSAASLDLLSTDTRRKLLDDDADLMGTIEVARLLGVSRQRVLLLAKRGDFPAPLVVLSMGNVWRGVNSRAWAASRAARDPR